MKAKQTKQSEKEIYDRFIKMANKAEVQARTFIEKNIKINPQARVKYSL